MIHPNYPSPSEIDNWCLELLNSAETMEIMATPVDVDPYSFRMGVRHHAQATYIKFTTNRGDVFYGYWQPVLGGGPAPLLVHVPGYGAEMSAHPELVAAGFNVLHVNPLGYATPSGPDETLLKSGNWPVLPDTVTSKGKEGYRIWLAQAAAAFLWARSQPSVQPSRCGWFGTSQGGGTALLLASIMKGFGVKAVAADVPFLTNFPLVYEKEDKGAYFLAFDAVALNDEEWRALGHIDTVSHAYRLDMPVLLTSGQLDNVTPRDSIESLFNALPSTRSYTEFAGQGHAYTAPFLRLAEAWFRTWM